jgi:hypothetical protein
MLSLSCAGKALHWLCNDHPCRNEIMNIVPRHAVRLVAICAFAMAFPQLASASDPENGATFRLAMGPMSAAQRNQGNTAKSDDAIVEPRRHIKRRHPHHAR